MKENIIKIITATVIVFGVIFIESLILTLIFDLTFCQSSGIIILLSFIKTFSKALKKANNKTSK